METDTHWYLICYDIRDPKRWAKAYKILKGRGEHLQYSIFRLHLNKTQLAALRWALSKILEQEDDLMVIRLCPHCAQNVVDSRNQQRWKEPMPEFTIL